MRRLDTTSTYSKRAYFFGIITLICFFIENGLVSLQTMTATTIPRSLSWTITILYFLTGAFTIFNSIKGIKEPNTFKKLIGLGIAILFMIRSMTELFSIT